MRISHLGAITAALAFSVSFAHAAVPASERQALLTFFEATGGESWSDKSGWGGAAGSECSWKGITCNDAQTTVTELWLEANNLTGPVPSALSGLPNLEVLYLANNSLSGTLPSSLFALTKLRTLTLSVNQLTGELSASVGNLTNLEALELAVNSFEGELPQTLASLTKLNTLTLYSNAFSGSIPSSIGSLSKLEYISLGDNAFTGTIPSTIGSLSLLRSLYLDDNQLAGGIPASLGQLQALEHLELDHNALSGAIPSSLAALSNLTTFDLTSNQLTGNIPPELGSLANLTYLSVALNQLSGSIPPSLGNLKKLTALDLQQNQLSGAIPKELGTLGALRYLALGYNGLSGPLPEALGDLGVLEELTAEYNRIEGTIPASFVRLSSLRKLDLAVNALVGPLPDLSPLANLREFSVSHNAIGGELPLWLAKLPLLEGIYFDETQISGTIPEEYARIKTLRNLYVSGNMLGGTLPQWLGELPELRVLLLAGNRFTGTIPSSITRLSNLSYFHIGANRLHGELPHDIGNLQQLQYFEINDNAFSGAIPPSFSTMKNLVYVVFANNEFTGALPQMEGFEQLELLNVSVNRLTGTFPVELTTLPKLQVLSLGGNAFNGPLPTQIGDFPALEFLGLWSNAFAGDIPSSIMNLTRLGEGQLDINHNGLFASQQQVRDFVASKHYGADDWQLTQTVAPTQVSVGAVTDRSVELSWQPIAYIYDEGGYRVSAATTAGGPPVVIVTTPEKESSSIVVRGLDPETTYHFTLASVTHPHDYQQNVVVSTPTAAVTARTGARVLSPADVVITRKPSGLIQIGGVPQNEDALILTNFGDQSTEITLHPGSENFFTASPLAFTLAAGASQRVRITSIPQPPGSYWSSIGISGQGVPADAVVSFELLSVAASSGAAVGEAMTSRVDISGAVGSTSVGSVTFANRGSVELRGVLVADVPWIITTPGVIAIPPNELRTINFTVDRSKRSRDIARGTATGVLSLIYVDGTSQQAAVADLRALSNHSGVSISTVTVVDTAKPPTASGAIPPLGPQEIARFIAGVRTLDYASRTFVSDLSITNVGGVTTADDVRLYFTAPASAAASVATIGAVSSGQAVSLSNVVNTVYGGSSPNGSLQLRTSSWDKLSVAAMLNGISASGNVAASLPVFRSDRSIRSGEKLYLVGIGKSTTLRGDLLVQETSGAPATVRVDFLTAAGAPVGTPLQLNTGAFGVAEAIDGVPAGAVTAVVTNEGSGSVAAYVQMIDATSGDAWSVVDWSRYFAYRATDDVRIPVAARDSGTSGRKRPIRRQQSQGGATVGVETATDVSMFNSGADEAVARLRFIDRSGSTGEATVTVAPGSTMLLDDVLLRTFNRSGRADGAIVATVTSGSLVFSSRMRLTAAGVSRGSAVPVVPPSAGLRLGESHVFAGIADAKQSTLTAGEAATYRTSLLIQETSGAPARVRVTLLFADGRAVVASNVAREYEIGANQSLSFERISREIIGPNRDSDFDDLFGMQLQVRVIAGEGSVLPLAIATENASGDTVVRIE